MCVFLGTSSARRKTEVSRLNTEFQAMANLKMSLDAILQFLIETENYRMLSAQEYTWKECPIRSGRVCERKNRTEVSLSFLKNTIILCNAKIFFTGRRIYRRK